MFFCLRVKKVMKNNIFIRIDNRKYISRKDKVSRFFCNFFNRIKVEKVRNGLLIVLPKKYCNNTIRLNSVKRQILGIIKQEKSNRILYSENVLSKVKIEEVRSVYNGKILMKILIFEILDYVYDVMSIKQELEDIYIFVNEYNKDNLYIINELSNKFKIVNIITQNLLPFKILEEKYENKNILITVSNNKRKSAKNAHMIVNLDFEKEDFQKYNISNSAIILNLNEEKQMVDRNFSGIIINNLNILVSNNSDAFIKEFYGDIKQQLFIESLILNMNYEEAREYILNENLKIDNVVGIRGIISKTEFLRIKSIT